MNLDQVMGSIAGTESGGNYNATNGRTGASGKYQIMPSNWAPWAKEAGLPAGAKQTPANQEKVARFKLSQYVEQFGSAQAAAVAWYAGPAAAKAWVKDPTAARFTRKQGAGNEPSINEYVQMTVGGGATTVTSDSVDETPTAAATATPKKTVTPASTPAEIEAYIRENYPNEAAFLANPEIRKKLYEFAVGDKPETELVYALKNTDYFKKHSEAYRKFDLLLGEDLGQAQQVIEKTRNTLSDVFAQNGITATKEELDQFSNRVIRGGLVSIEGATAGKFVDASSMNDFLVGIVRQQNPDGGLPSGTASVTADALAKLAHDYMVPVARRDLEKAALDIQSGQLTEDQFKQRLSKQAATFFDGDPHLAQQIQAGSTPWDLFATQRATIGKYFEVDADSVDLTDPKWADVMQSYDENAKVRRPMTYGETIKWAMQNAPKTTQWYKQQDASVATTLAQAFGKQAA